MIISNIDGGLGNQLFEYAAAKQIAVNMATTLKLDISNLEKFDKDKTHRKYELSKLNISAEIATKAEIESVTKIIREKYYAILRHFIKKGTDYYVKGYWQKEKYFKRIEPIIREEFTFRTPITDSYLSEIKEQIENSNSVSVHFRRGDYVTNPAINAYHGVCSLDYYQRAVEILRKKEKNLHLFIFSDDIDWVKTHFKVDIATTYVDKSIEEQHSDFQLMCMCKHNIIANSSYSWWAAWLNPNPEKTVIAPKKWFKKRFKQIRERNRVPAEWLRI